MRAIVLDDSRLLETWDRAAALDRPWRELALLESACGAPLDELAHLRIGERDRLLLDLHIRTFGSRLDCETSCPSCGTRLELSVDAAMLIVPHRVIEPSELEIISDDWTVRFRLPDSTDIAAINDGADDASGDVIADRCIAVIAGDHADAASVSAIRSRVAERMSALDAQADVSLSLTCAVCNDQWQSPFDVAAFLCREVDARVAQVTAEVHQLASAYGWSEDSVLAMSAARRRRYIDLLQQ